MSPLELLLDALDESRERLLIALEPLDDEALLARHIRLDERSISDILTNLTAWESELVTGLMKIEQNKPPKKLLQALADPQSYDHAFYATAQNRDLDQVFDDLQLVRIQLEDWISAFSDRDLSHPRRYSWLKGRALRGIIAAATIDRENQYLPLLEALSQEWQAAHEPLVSDIDTLDPDRTAK